VENAGVTLTLAQTGWRQSEFGFPLNSIAIAVNAEIKDSAYTPFRYHVFWKVPKTSGDTFLDREVTLSTYLLSHQLHVLTRANKGDPCLYVSNSTDSNKWKSEGRIGRKVMRHWGNFVQNYTPFKELEELEKLRQTEILTSAQEKCLRSLTKKYPDTYKTKDLLYVKQQVERDLPKLTALNINRIDQTSEKGSERLFAYLKGELSPEHSEVLDKYLEPEFVQELKGSVKARKDITRDMLSAAKEQLLQDVCYPSPHAFRHIWAECVLRRYRGDVGKFIRANFKHIDERFFARYLRKKSFRSIYQAGKRTTINSMVRGHLLALRDEHRDMAGRFDVFVRRLGKNTKVMSMDQVGKETAEFCDQNVIDINVNSWTSCFLRLGTYKKANCSKDGVPQPQNSSISLCLGCVNGNIAEGNYLGIMIAIGIDIDACLNKYLPKVFKADSIKNLEAAKKEIAILKRNSGSTRYDDGLNEITHALQVAYRQKDNFEGAA
jgi:hypothetical protein